MIRRVALLLQVLTKVMNPHDSVPWTVYMLFSVYNNYHYSVLCNINLFNC